METETKSASKKIEVLAGPMKFIFREVDLYLYKSIIRPGM